MAPLRAVAAALLVAAAAALVAYCMHSLAPQPAESPPVNAPAATPHEIFTPEQLAPFTGKPKGTPIYLAILGDVFDVTEGRKHYGPQSGYSFYAGRDATRAFSTGEDSAEGLTDAVDGLDVEALKAIAGWHEFYMKHETYTRRGIVVGRHYDASGAALGIFPWARLKLHEQREEEMKRALPECNSRWTQATGSEVWCSTRSGGIEREWVGVPRLYSPSLDPRMQPADGEPAESGTGSPARDRCVCASDELVAQAPPYLRAYEGCEGSAERCVVRPKRSG